MTASMQTQFAGQVDSHIRLAPGAACSRPEPQREHLTAATLLPDIVGLDALELSQAIWSRQLSCVEVMSAYLDHIEHVNIRFNAIVSIQDRAGLLRQSQARDGDLARGDYLGWMHGLPHAVKDLATTAGIVTTQGSLTCKDHLPTRDAIFVQRIKSAGAIIVGKTNTPEFGLGSQTYNSVFGTTLNAYNSAKTAGGSSGGAAVAVALRMLPVADGSDSAGSIRNPAAFNNVFGLRPSPGRVPSEGRDIFLPSLGVVGPIARTVRDLALLLSVQAGHDARVPSSLPGGPDAFASSLERDVHNVRIGWLADLQGHLPFEPGIVELCNAALKTFQGLGCKIEPAKVDFPAEGLWSSWVKLRSWQIGGARSVISLTAARLKSRRPASSVNASDFKEEQARPCSGESANPPKHYEDPTRTRRNEPWAKSLASCRA